MIDKFSFTYITQANELPFTLNSEFTVYNFYSQKLVYMFITVNVCNVYHADTNGTS